MSDNAQAVEGNPIDAIYSDLMAAGRRRVGARRRRRVGVVASMALLGLVGTAAASSLAGFSTGVSQIDQLLDTNKTVQQEAVTARAEQLDQLLPQSCAHAPRGSESEERCAALKARAAMPSLPDATPGPGGSSQPVQVPWGDGTQAVGVAYVSRNLGICLAVATPSDGQSDGSVAAAPGCAPATLIAKRLGAQPALVAGGSTTRDRILVEGFARADVDALTLTTSAGPVQARLSEPWTPAVEGGVALRAFVATRSTEGLQPDELNKLMTAPELTAQLPDGAQTFTSPSDGSGVFTTNGP